MHFVSMLSSGNEKRFVHDDLRRVMTEFGTYTHYAWTSDDPPPETELLQVLGRTDVLLTGWASPKLPVSLLLQPERRLRYICNLTGGIQRTVPREYLEAGLLVSNWGDGPMWYLAEGNLALMLACSREMSRVHTHMLDRPQWTFPYRNSRPTLRRKTIGFLGFGAIARILHKLLLPLEVKVLIFDPYITDVPAGCGQVSTLEELFSRSEVLTIQAGLCRETEGLVHGGLLKLLPEGAIFVNTARGQIVREAELIEFLRQRKDVFAGLDVFEVEPLPTDSPLLQLDNVICYPHSVCGGGDDMYTAASEFAAANVRAYATGVPLKAVINPEMFDRMT